MLLLCNRRLKDVANYAVPYCCGISNVNNFIVNSQDLFSWIWLYARVVAQV